MQFAINVAVLLAILSLVESADRFIGSKLILEL